MTMPSEEIRALKRAHKFLVEECLWQSWKTMLWKIITGRFKQWRHDCYWLCLRHYPFDCKIDRLYSNEVCPDCESDRQFCKCKNGE